MRVLIIDDSRRCMQIMRRFLAVKLPDVEVTEYDPEQRGMPAATFDWSQYDVLLLDFALSGPVNGLQWLAKNSNQTGFPATVMVSAKNDPEITADALKVGAHGVISKRDLTPDSLTKAVNAAAAAARPSTGVTAPGARNVNDFEIVEQARQGARGGSGYKFTRLIGQGAMSRVYLAERIENHLTVVVKIMDGTLSEDEESVKRFIQEAEIVSGLDSPYVVKVFEQGFTNKYGFMVMEFFSRGDLKQRLEHGISPEDALAYLLNIAYGLEVIHEVGIVHRDLKPANIMFRADDSLALADFGISKRLDDTSELTVVGSLLGTPHYMSPEQMRTLPVDRRSDLYSVGVILYEMLTGQKPYRGTSLTEVIYKHLQEPIPALPREVSDFSPIVARLLAKEPEDRYPNASSLIAALESLSLAA